MRRTVLGVVVVVAAASHSLVASGESKPPITAVFDVEVRGVDLGNDVADRISEYIAGRLAVSGRYQVVPRDQLKSRLIQQKNESFKQCYEQSCQIELGKELAAQKTLATQVLKLGSSCKVNLVVFDLMRAATEGGATASGDCTEDGIVNALDTAIGSMVTGPRCRTNDDCQTGQLCRSGDCVEGPPPETRKPQGREVSGSLKFCFSNCSRLIGRATESDIYRCETRCSGRDVRFAECIDGATSIDDFKRCF